MCWMMDEIILLDLFYDVGNVKLGSEVWKKLVVEVMVNVFGQYYFSELWYNGQWVKFDNCFDGYGFECDGLQVVFIFILLLVML